LMDDYRDQSVLFDKTILGNHIKIGFEFDLSPVKIFSKQVIPPSSIENKLELLLNKRTIFIGDQSLQDLESPHNSLKEDVIIAAVLQGLQSSLERCFSNRFPFINTHVRLKKLQLLNGFPFSEGMLRMASYISLNNILSSIPNILLEPAMKLNVQVHDAYLKAISKDLINFRNGHILALDDSSSAEYKNIIATVPVSGIEGYSSHFRSLTKGKGHYSYSLEGYSLKSSS